MKYNVSLSFLQNELHLRMSGKSKIDTKDLKPLQNISNLK